LTANDVEGDDELGGRPAPKDMTRRTLDSLAWASSGAIIQTFLQIGVLLVLARLLTPQDFGVIGAATLVLGFTQVFWQLGVGPALIQRPAITREHMETAFTTSIILGLVFATGIFFASPAISDFFGMPRLLSVLRATTVVYLLGGISLVAESLLRRELRFKQVALIQLAAYVGYGVVSIALAILGAGVWALVGGHLTRATIETGLVLKNSPHPKRIFVHRSVLRELLSFGSGVTAAQIANYCALQGDNFVVGRMLGAGPLGVYGRAYNLMAMPANLFGSAVDTVLFPAMAKVQDEPTRFAAAFRRSMAVTALIGLPISALTFVLAPEIVQVVLGSQWTGAESALRILALGIFFRTGYKLGGSVARAKGLVHRIAWRQGVYAVTVVAGAWIGASTLELRGVAYAVLISLAVIFALLTQLALKASGLSVGSLIKANLPILLFTAVVLGVAYASAEVVRMVETPEILVLVSVTAVSVGIAAALGKWMPGLFLGEDGLWGLRTINSYAKQKLSARRGKKVTT